MPPMLGGNAILFPSWSGIGVGLIWRSQQRIGNTSSYGYRVAQGGGRGGGVRDEKQVAKLRCSLDSSDLAYVTLLESQD